MAQAVTCSIDLVLAMLNAISALQQHCPRLSVDGLTVFLHIGRMEGCCVKELAYRCRMSESRVSRALKGLRRAEGALSLIRMLQQSDDRRYVRVFLSAAGAALLEEMSQSVPAKRRGSYSVQAESSIS